MDECFLELPEKKTKGKCIICEYLACFLYIQLRMNRINTSISIVFSIFCLLSFRFIESDNQNHILDGQQTEFELDAKNCSDETAVYFYTSSETYSQYLDSAYSKLFTSHNRPNKQVFNLALKGYAKLLEQGQLGKKNILAFIDYSLSANIKRFWVVDLKTMKLLHYELVAHGRNSGNEFAKQFSNKVNSFQTSLGFFITGDIYQGKHDKSIRMNGVEKSFNGNALDRGIVIHGADYVDEAFIKQNQRLGRSLGCPAVSEKVIGALSKTISNGVCLFAYYPNKLYLRASKLVNSDAVLAANNHAVSNNQL